jgi:hypothetical protein
MKIKIIDSNSKKPVINNKIQLQVKGKDSGFLSLTTDATGFVTLDEKYNGQQLSAPQGGAQGPWVTACENAVVLLSTKQKLTETR